VIDPLSPLLDDKNIESFQNNLLEWFKEAGREFPWRSENDPYKIIIAEKLLQQTRAREAVVEAYKSILEKYPTPHLLAQSRLSTLEDVIRPLGLLYRAKELKALAEELVEHHSGEVPDNLDELLGITGIGSYIARATLSFAFKKDIAVVDTNIARLLFRLYLIDKKMPPNPARSKKLLEMADALIPRGKSKQVNLAMIDLCGEICLPKNPKCSSCPILEYCRYGSLSKIALP